MLVNSFLGVTNAAAAKDDRINILVSLAGMVETKAFCQAEFGEEIPGKGFMWEEEDYPLSQLFVDDLHRIESTICAAREVRSPWLIIHGDQDDVVLPKDSQSLFNNLKSKKKHVVIEGADHCFEGHYDQLASEISDWLGVYVK